MDPLEHLRMVKDRAAGILPRGADFRRIRALRGTETGFDRAVWREMCAKGWLTMRIPEQAGGAGLGGAAFCGLAEQFGRDLVPEPVIPAAMAAQMLPPSRLPDVLAGACIVLPAWQETSGALDPAGETALHNGTLTGRKTSIPMAAGADAFLVCVPGGLALVERGAPGVRVDIQPTQDGGNVGTLVLDHAPAEPIDGDPVDPLDATIMANAAYLLGLSERAFEITLDHIKLREQSGQRDGAFPAMRHRIPDMEVQLSLTRSVVDAAAQALDSEPRRAVRQAVVSRAHLRACDAALTVTRTCLHLYGGTGYTEAADIGLFPRKAMALTPLYGSASAHRARLRTNQPDARA